MTAKVESVRILPTEKAFAHPQEKTATRPFVVKDNRMTRKPRKELVHWTLTVHWINFALIWVTVVPHARKERLETCAANKTIASTVTVANRCVRIVLNVKATTTASMCAYRF